jgi:hypothetical protein
MTKAAGINSSDLFFFAEHGRRERTDPNESRCVSLLLIFRAAEIPAQHVQFFPSSAGE